MKKKSSIVPVTDKTTVNVNICKLKSKWVRCDFLIISQKLDLTKCVLNDEYNYPIEVCYYQGKCEVTIDIPGVKQMDQDQQDEVDKSLYNAMKRDQARKEARKEERLRDKKAEVWLKAWLAKANNSSNKYIMSIDWCATYADSCVEEYFKRFGDGNE